MDKNIFWFCGSFFGFVGPTTPLLHIFIENGRSELYNSFFEKSLSEDVDI